MTTSDFFTAPQVAKICSTDLKTIHNWVNRGEIKSFRTPGRHLRFKKQDVVEFLTKFGYPIPSDLNPAKKIVMIIDPKEETASSIANALSEDMEVCSYNDHMDALLQIGKNKPSFVLINCKSNPEMLRVAQNISKNEVDLHILTYGIARESSASEAITYIDSEDAAIIKDKVKSIVELYFKAAV